MQFLFFMGLFSLAMVMGMFVIEGDLDNAKFKQQAIERGYALYCPLDGKFAWKGECEKN